MTADAAEIIKWQLRWIKESADELTESELEWAIKMEESFNRKGFLSPRESEILEEIYKRRT